MMSNKFGKIIFVVTEDWFFCSHFLDRAIAAHKKGYEVAVITRAQKQKNKIASHGLKLIPLNWSRRGMNIFRELKTIFQLAKIYRKERPDIVHHVAMKPIFYGSIAGLISRVPFIINAPVGMGYIFVSKQLKAIIFRPFVLLAYRLLLNPVNSRVIFENSDDLKMLVDKNIVRQKNSVLIRGAGVNLTEFAPTPEPESAPVVILATRMLWDKGVGEFIDAAKQIKKKGIKCRIILVGGADPENPASISETTLLGWHSSGIVEWWGHREDMANVFAGSHIVVLPSYREGLPKVLLEAASCGRPLIATDVAGCREIVKHDKNGLLVPARDPKALADAMLKLIENLELRKKMGAYGRRYVESDFSLDLVVKKTLGLYEQLLRVK